MERLFRSSNFTISIVVVWALALFISGCQTDSFIEGSLGGESEKVTIESAPTGSGKQVSSLQLGRGEWITVYAIRRGQADEFIDHLDDVNWTLNGGLGNLTIETNGYSATYKAPASELGTATLKASWQGISTEVTIKIVNQEPDLAWATCPDSVNEDAPFSCTFTVSDPDGSSPTISLGPSHNCAWISASALNSGGTVSATPADNHVGDCTLAIKAKDSDGISSEIQKTLSVLNVQPTLTIAGASIDQAAGQTIVRADADVQASDEGDGLYSLVTPQGANPDCRTVSTLSIDSSSGEILMTPDGTNTNDCDIRVRFDDENATNNQVEAEFTINIIPTDTTAPDPVTSITLYSEKTSNTSTSTTVSPDITLAYTGNDTGSSGFSHAEYRIENSGTGTVAQDWTTAPSRVFRATGLSLTSGQSYVIKARTVDNQGNTSTPATSVTFLIDEVTNPYASLPDPTGSVTLSDGSTITGTQRLSPLSADSITLEGQATSDLSSSHAGVFVYANTFNFGSGYELSSNGGDNSGGIDGGSGASGGGGGGAPCGGTPGIGGSAGADGADAMKSGVQNGGLGGQGTLASYIDGSFLFGNGGDGGTGNASGGTGTNGGGGGGGGKNGTCGSMTGGGGGGGGGLVALVTDQLRGQGLIQARGGHGATIAPRSYRNAGGGGGGVVWVAARSSDGKSVPDVSGGRGVNVGSDGTVKYFQLNADGSLTQRLPTDAWDENTPVAAQNPAIGPFDNPANPSVSSASNLTLSASLDTSPYSRTQPLIADQLTISGTVGWQEPGPAAHFIRAQDVVFQSGSVLDASGRNGNDAAHADGPDGGEGGNAGGPGGTAEGNCAVDGGNGASGFRKASKNEGGSLTANPGRAFSALFSYGFNYGTGGDGGTIMTSSTHAAGKGGPGANGAGGGGAGGNGNCSGYTATGGGGGGGGGLIVIVADSITGNGTVQAIGGNGGAWGTASTTGTDGAGGGGGVIWIATRSYDGSLTADVSGGTGHVNGTAGTARIFQIDNNNNLTERAFSDTW